MNWFLRFSLGLPARCVDVAEMQRDVPELLDSTDREPRLDGLGVFLPIIFFTRSGKVLDEPRELVGALRTWAGEAPRPEVLESPRRLLDENPCEHQECPRKRGASVPVRTSESDATGASSLEQPVITHVMVVGGGPGQNPPRARFLDLVRRVHSKAGAAKKVFVTDPYLLTDASESGTHGGFGTFCAYLETLQLAPDAELFIPPGPKSPTMNRTRWIESIEKKFNLKVASFASGLSFHDRFYIVEHVGGDVRGVFGPSLNGLSDTDIVLIGELEFPNALATLSRWFDMKTPKATSKKTQRKRPPR